MKRSFTYREYTLVIGVVVAAIIVFTLWVSQVPATETPQPQTLKKPSGSIPQAAKSLVKKVVAEIRM